MGWEKELKRIKFHGDVLQVIITSEFSENMKYLIGSSNTYAYPFVVLGLGQKVRGYADRLLKMRDFLRELTKNGEKFGLKEYMNEGLKILYTDSENSLLVEYPYEISIVHRRVFQDAIVFLGDRRCFPDESMESEYPESPTNMRFLNSRAYMGSAIRLLELFEKYPIPSIEYDDQFYFTEAYLTGKFNLVIDHFKKLFGNLDGSPNFATYYTLEANRIRNRLRSTSLIENLSRGSYPFVVVHGGRRGSYGQSNLIVLQNFFPSIKSSPFPFKIDPPLKPENGSSLLKKLQNNQSIPKVFLAVFLDDYSPFFEEFVVSLLEIDYPKEHLVLFVNYHSEREENRQIENHLKYLRSIKKNSIGYFKVIVNHIESTKIAKKTALDLSVQENCDFYFTTDSLLFPNSLNLLIAEDKPFVSPFLQKHYRSLSNFWCLSHPFEGVFISHPICTEINYNTYNGIFRVPIVWVNHPFFFIFIYIYFNFILILNIFFYFTLNLIFF